MSRLFKGIVKLRKIPVIQVNTSAAMKLVATTFAKVQTPLANQATVWVSRPFSGIVELRSILVVQADTSAFVRLAQALVASYIIYRSKTTRWQKKRPVSLGRLFRGMAKLKNIFAAGRLAENPGTLLVELSTFPNQHRYQKKFQHQIADFRTKCCNGSVAGI